MSRIASRRSRLSCDEQVEHAHADRDVEHRGRLVRDQQVGLDRERARDGDALSLAAGELVRVAIHELLGGVEPDRAQELERARARTSPGVRDPAVARAAAARGGARRCAPGSASRTGPGRPSGPGGGRRARPGAARARARPRRPAGPRRRRGARAAPACRAMVLLPLPDSPTRATASPRSIWKAISCAATSRLPRAKKPPEAIRLADAPDFEEGNSQVVWIGRHRVSSKGKRDFVRLPNIVYSLCDPVKHPSRPKQSIQDLSGGSSRAVRIPLPRPLGHRSSA